ncbi:MAG: type II secretion system F family protein [Haloarculaceae archaeon]
MSQETPDYQVPPADSTTDDEPAVPEYELEQYFPREDAGLSGEARERLREQYGYVRAYFKAHPGQYTELQRWLNQARMGTTYDIYLTKSVYYAVGLGLAGLIVGVLLTFGLVSSGLIFGISSPVDAPADLARLVGDNRVLVAGVVLSLLGMVLAGVGTFAGRYYYPRVVVDNRRREIDVTLPHAIVYMYALSYGGMNTIEVITRVAGTEDVYGEVANEFDVIVRDVELFGNDLFTAIRDARNLTPSDNMEQFLDDMLSVIDSGSDISAFFESESKAYMEEAREEQDSFLETLSILSEIFVVGFVAAPLFLIVTLVVISLLGGAGALTQTYALVYAVLPLGMVMFLLVVDVLSQPYKQPATLLFDDEEADVVADELDEDDERLESYQRHNRRLELLELFEDPVRTIRERDPLLSLVVTVPAGLLVAGLLVATGIADPGAFGEEPIAVTTLLVVVPLLVAGVPLSVLHEIKRRRRLQVARRFPDTLNILSSANEMGIRLTEALELVSRWSEGILAVEMRKVRNDIEWNFDVRRALLGLANRLRVPQVTRTMKLIADGSRSSGDLSRILSIAAEDTRNRHKIAEERRREMSAYIAIVVIGFLVYLAVVLLLDVSYLTPISNLAAPENPTGGSGGVLFSVSNVPVTAYRMVFFHSALIQGIGSGLLAGKLADDDILSGLKYSILLVLITLAVFLLI